MDNNILKEYAATANNPKYKGNWDVIDSKFPELKGYDKKLLREYAATANNPAYKGNWDVIDSKFPEFSTPTITETTPTTFNNEDASRTIYGNVPGQTKFKTGASPISTIGMDVAMAKKFGKYKDSSIQSAVAVPQQSVFNEMPQMRIRTIEGMDEPSMDEMRNSILLPPEAIDELNKIKAPGKFDREQERAIKDYQAKQREQELRDYYAFDPEGKAKYKAHTDFINRAEENLTRADQDLQSREKAFNDKRSKLYSPFYSGSEEEYAQNDREKLVLDAERTKLNDARNAISAYKEGKSDNSILQFLGQMKRGAGSTVENIASWGMSSLLNDMSVNAAQSKYASGKRLTPDESKLLNTAALSQYVTDTMGANRTFAQDLASGIEQSLPYMATFLTTGGIAKGITGGLAKSIIKEAGIAGVRGLEGGISKGLARTLGVANHIADAGLQAGIITILDPRTYDAAVKNINGQSGYEVDPKTNRIQYTGRSGGMDFNTAVTNAITSSLIENASEFAGEAFEPLGEAVKRFTKTKLPGVAKMIYGNNKFFNGVENLMEKAKWNGTLGEFMEEQLATIGHSLAGDGQGQWSDLTNARNQALTLANVMAIGSGAWMANTAGNQIAKYQMAKQYNKAEQTFDNVMGADGISLKNVFVNGSIEDKNALMEFIMNDEQIPNEQKQATWDYFVAGTRWGSFNAAINDMIAKTVNDKTGTVVTGMIRGEESPIKIISGLALTTNENNELVPDEENSDESIYYKDGDGKVHPTTIDNLTQLTETSPEEVQSSIHNEYMQAGITDEMTQTRPFNAYTDEELQQAMEDADTLMNSGMLNEQQLQQLQAQQANMQAEAEIRQQEVGSGESVAGSEQSVVSSEQPVVGSGESVVGSDESVVGSETSPLTTLPSERGTEEQPVVGSEQPQYPVLADGTPDFGNMDEQQTYNYIRDTENEDEARSSVERDIMRAQKAIQKNDNKVREHQKETFKLLSKAKSIQHEAQIKAEQARKKQKLDEERKMMDERLGRLKDIISTPLNDRVSTPLDDQTLAPLNDQTLAPLNDQSVNAPKSTEADLKNPQNEPVSAPQNDEVSMTDSEKLDAEIMAQNPNMNPTEKQKESGNYDKARVNVQGFNITVENPRGSVRSGVDPDGKAWSITMQNHYGELDGTEGYDGDPIDVFIGPNPNEGGIFVIDQVSTSLNQQETTEQGHVQRFDESKVMIGFDSAEEAKAAYMSNYEPGWTGFGAITPAGENFKKWLYDGKKQRKAYSEYAEVRSQKSEVRSEETEDRSQKPKQIINPFQRRINRLGDYVSLEDYVLRSIAGGTKFVWETTGSNKGLGEELGFNGTNNTEKKLRKSILSPDGITPQEMAHQIWQDHAETGDNIIPGINGMSSQDITNTVLEVLNSIHTQTEALQAAEALQPNEPETFGFDKDEVIQFMELPMSEAKMRIIEQIPDDILASFLGIDNFTPEQLTTLDTLVTGYSDQIQNDYDIEQTTKSTSTKTSPDTTTQSPTEGSPEERPANAETEVEKENTDQLPDVGKTIENPSEGENVQFQAAVDKSKQIDEQYFNAIQRGDMETAQRIVDQQAANNGYISNNDYKLSHRAPSADTTSSEEKMDAGGDFSLVEIANGYSNQPSDYFSAQGPRWYGYDYYSGRQSQSAINSAIRAIKSGNEATVTIYRAVPKSLKENEIRNGDWVTLSPQYAKEHGQQHIDGPYKIQSMEVPASQVWWDGNDINEWGYDDGKGYVYKDTKNNRKLNDVIVRDDNGEIIPPSKRFNQRINDPRYHTGTTLTHTTPEEVADTVEQLMKTGLAKEVRMVTPGEIQGILDGTEQKLRTPSGTIYGFVKNGVVYLNSETPNLNTPIHEFGHLWVDAIEGTPLYERGAELVKETPYWERVNTDPNYKDLSETARTKEAMSMAIGDKGEAVKQNLGLFARIKVWINDVWKRIGSKFGIQNLTPAQIQNLTWNDFVDVAVSELLSEKPLTQAMNDNKEKQLDIINKTNPMLDDYHTGIRKVEDINTLEEAINNPEWDYDEYNPDYTRKMAQNAIETGKITVYSSNKIKNGVFVSPSKMEAESYSGNGNVYSKEVNISDIAWIDPTQGQYAEISSKLHTGTIDSEFKSKNKKNNLPETIEVDGIQRPTRNSNGKPIHSTEAGIHNFWKWFGDSKVVDEQGRPLVVYHGTASDFDVFNNNKSNFEQSTLGFYFTSGAIANTSKGIYYGSTATEYAQNAQSKGYSELDGANIIPTYLKIDNPIKIDANGWYSANTAIDKQRSELTNSKQTGKYDGIISSYSDKEEGGNEEIFVVFSPTQIKSATGNDGSFDPNEPDIRFQIIGEQGAAALDAADASASSVNEATTRLDNLAIAKEMEAGRKNVLRVDENGRNIVWENDEYMISVNNPENATYIALWNNGKKVGELFTTKGRNSATNGYLSIQNVEIDKQHRGKGLSSKMYDALLNHLGNKYKGISSENEQRVNKKQVPQIWKRLNATEIDGNYTVDKKQFTPKEIRLATGWEKGVDGLWRYEIMDGIIDEKHLSDLLERKWSENIQSGLINATSLPDLYKNEELYNAYPQLKKVDVVLYEDKNIKASASYNSSTNQIFMYNPFVYESIGHERTNLIHEIQHAIQDIEGFAKGGNIEMAKQLGEEGERYISALTIARERDRLLKTKEEKTWVEATNKAIKELEELFDEKYDKRTIELSGLKHEVLEERAKKLPNYDTINKSSKSIYNRLAGETEARNASARMNFTPEERLQRLLSETADVAPEDQIVLMNGMGVSNSESEPEKPKYEAGTPLEKYANEITAYNNRLKEIKRLKAELNKSYENKQIKPADFTAETKKLNDEKQIVENKVKRVLEGTSTPAELEGLKPDFKDYNGDLIRFNSDLLEWNKRNAVQQPEAPTEAPAQPKTMQEAFLAKRNNAKDYASRKIELLAHEANKPIDMSLTALNTPENIAHNLTVAKQQLAAGSDAQSVHENTGWLNTDGAWTFTKYDLAENELPLYERNFYEGMDQYIQKEGNEGSMQANVEKYVNHINAKARAKAMQLEDERLDTQTAEQAPEYDADKEAERLAQTMGSVDELNEMERQEQQDIQQLASDNQDINELMKQLAERRKQKGNKLKNKIQDVSQQVSDYIRTAVGKDIVDVMSEREFKSLIDKLEKATSAGNLRTAMKAVNQAIQQIVLRKNRAILKGFVNGKIINTFYLYELDAAVRTNNQITPEYANLIDNDLMNTLSNLNSYNRYFEIQGKNKAGVSIAKNVDEGTRQIMQFVRDYKDLSREQIATMEEELNNQRNELNARNAGEITDAVREQTNRELLRNERKQIALEQLKRLADIKDVEADIQVLKNTDWQDEAFQGTKAKWEVILERQKDLEKLQMASIRDFATLLDTGRNLLSQWKEAEQAHNDAIADEALAAVTDKSVKTQGEEKANPTIKKRNLLSTWWRTPYTSFEFMLSNIDRNHPNGEGPMYRRWMPALVKASDQFNNGYNQFRSGIDKAVSDIMGTSLKEFTKDTRKDSGMSIAYSITLPDGTKQTENIPMTKGELMYVWLTWQHADGREKMEAMDITQDDIDTIAETLGDRYIEFARWTQEYLDQNRERYNETHNAVFGTSMGKIKNYFPLKYAEKDLTPQSTVDEVSPALPSTMTGAIINRVRTKKHIKLDENFLDTLMEHGEKMESWNAYAKLRKDLNSLIKNREFRNRMEANNTGIFEDFVNAAKIAVDANQPNPTDAESMYMNFVRNLQGAAIAGRLNTALKQSTAVASYVFYKANPKYYAYLAKNLSDAVQATKTIQWAKKNLPTYAERLGLGNFGNEKLLVDKWENSLQAAGKTRITGKVGRAIDKTSQAVTEIGMAPNKWVDGYIFAVGSHAIYEYEKQRYQKAGYSETEAEQRALFDAANYSNKVSQSSNPAYLAPIQKSKTFWAQMFTVFLNANFAFGRNAYEGTVQLLRSGKQVRTLTAENEASGMSEEEAKAAAQKTVLNANGQAVLKIIYSEFIANFIFQMFDSVYSRMMGGGVEDDDDEKWKKIIDAAWKSPLNNVLGGGNIIAIIEGFQPQSLLDSETSKAVKELKNSVKDGFSTETARLAVEYSIKFGLGLNLETLTNIYMGIEKGIVEKGGSVMAYQYITNVPKSVRAQTAVGKLEPGESLIDYANRVKLAHDRKLRADEEKELILKKVYSDNGDMTRFNRAVKLADEWNKLQTKEYNNETKSDRYKELEKLDKDYVLTDIHNYVQNAVKWYRIDIKNNKEPLPSVMQQDKESVYAKIEKLEAMQK